MWKLLAIAALALGAHSAAADGPGDWVGRYAYDLLNSPEMAARLGALMGAEALTETREVIVVGSAMATDGEWVAGFGCMPHACADAYGAVAISTRDGQVVVALRRAGGPARLWGELGRAMPGPVLQVLAGQ